MVEIEVVGAKGCVEAKMTLEPGKMAIVAGFNGAGKSTFGKLVGAAIANKKMPCGEAQDKAGKYVEPGYEYASVSVQFPEGSRRITWTHGGVRNEGELRSFGANASGFGKFMDMEIKARAAFLIELLDAKPEEKDFKTELETRLGIERAEQLHETLWRDIGALGWESVAKTKGEDATFAKRKWQEITSKPRWDTGVGAKWLPDSWEPDLAKLTVAQLEAECDKAKDAHFEALKAEAVNESEVKALQAQVAELLPLGSQVEKAKKDTEAQGAVLTEAKAVLSALPPANIPVPLECPHCSGAVFHEGPKLVKAQKIDSAELALRKTELDAANTVVVAAQKHLAELETEYRDLVAQRKAAEQAAEKLKKIHEERKAAGSSAVSVEAAKGALDRAMSRLGARNKKHLADVQHEKVLENIQIVEIVAPDGLRRTKLQDALKQFCVDYLEPLCETAKWEAITITPDLDTTYKGDSHAVISKGERFRVDAALQIAFGIMQESPLLIFDDTDSADARGQGGLIAMLVANQLTSIVCFKANAPDGVPDLMQRRAGCTYWMAAGKMQPVGEMLAGTK